MSALSLNAWRTAVPLATTLNLGVTGCNDEGIPGFGTGFPFESSSGTAETASTADTFNTTVSIPTTTEVSASTVMSGVDTTAGADSTTGEVLERAVLDFPFASPFYPLLSTRAFLLAEEYPHASVTGYEFCYSSNPEEIEGDACPNSTITREAGRRDSFIPNLVAGKGYSVKVRALLGSQASPFSSIKTFSVLPVNARLLFDDEKGTTATDELGANNGTLQGGAVFSSGFVDGGVAFDGATGYVAIPHSADFEIGTGDFALSLWFNPAVTGSTQALVDKRHTAKNGSTSLWELYRDPSGYLLFGATGCASSLNSREAAVEGEWTNAVVSRHGSTMRLYVNGVEQDSIDCTEDLTNPGSVAIGCLSPDCSGEAFSGVGDELVFTSGLTYLSYQVWNDFCSAAGASDQPPPSFFDTCDTSPPS